MNHQEAAKSRAMQLRIAVGIAAAVRLYGARLLAEAEIEAMYKTGNEEVFAAGDYYGANIDCRPVSHIPPELKELYDNAAKLAVALEWKWRRTADIEQFREGSFKQRQVMYGANHIARMIKVAKKHMMQDAVGAIEELRDMQKMLESAGGTCYDARSWVKIEPRIAVGYGIDATQFPLRTLCEEEIVDQLRGYSSSRY